MTFCRLLWRMVFEWVAGIVPRPVGILLYTWAKRCRHCGNPVGDHFGEDRLCIPLPPEPPPKYAVFTRRDSALGLVAKMDAEQYARLKTLDEEREKDDEL